MGDSVCVICVQLPRSKYLQRDRQLDDAAVVVASRECSRRHSTQLLHPADVVVREVQ